MSEALAVRDPAIVRTAAEPEEVVARATKQANALMQIVESRHLYVEISGRKHITVEGWQTLARFDGCMISVAWSKPLVEDGEKVGYEARAEVVRISDGIVLTGAEAECRTSEDNWSDRDDFALRSMAQTRAQSKAARMALSWVAVLAGYAGTPAEEMTGAAPRTAPSGLPACPACGKTTAVIRGKAEYGGGFVCFKKKNGCGHKWQETPAPGEDKAAASSDRQATEAGPAEQPTPGAGVTPLDAAWVNVKEAREARGMSKDQVLGIIRRTYPSLVTKGGEVDLSKMDLLMVQNLALLLGQEP